MKKSNFTKKQINFILKNYAFYGSFFCAKHLNLHPEKIQKKANHLGIILLPETKSKLTSEYNCKQKVYKQKKEFDNFIKHLTPEKIYFLGILWADGHLEKKSFRISLSLQVEDGKSIIKSLLKCGLSFSIKERETYRYSIKNKNRLDFRITNRFLYNFLKENNYHIKSGASADKILSKVPEHLKHYWWRGFIDGDGYFGRNEKSRLNILQITSTFNQDWSFIKNIENKLNISFKIQKYAKEKTACSHILLHRINQIQTFGNFIYNNYEKDKIGLLRKYKKFKTIVYKPHINIPNQKRNPKTKFIGVYISRHNKKSILYVMAICKNNKRYTYYSTNKNKAAEMYDKVCLYLYSEKHKLNFNKRKENYLKFNKKENPLLDCNIHQYYNNCLIK